MLRLSCHIDNNNKPIDLLHDGLKISMNGQIEKQSQFLGRNAIYSKTSKINKLPSYLCVQFVRFYWKQGSDVQDTKAGKAKILRSVSFPMTLDVFEFCTDALQASLKLGRDFESKLLDDQEKVRYAKAEVKPVDTKEDVDMKEESKEVDNKP